MQSAFAIVSEAKKEIASLENNLRKQPFSNVNELMGNFSEKFPPLFRRNFLFSDAAIMIDNSKPVPL